MAIIAVMFSYLSDSVLCALDSEHPIYTFANQRNQQHINSLMDHKYETDGQIAAAIVNTEYLEQDQQNL